MMHLRNGTQFYRDTVAMHGDFGRVLILRYLLMQDARRHRDAEENRFCRETETAYSAAASRTEKLYRLDFTDGWGTSAGLLRRVYDVFPSEADAKEFAGEVIRGTGCGAFVNPVANGGTQNG